ncbi:hypothetical protein Hanom_Chr12g01086891 [Helianthus anomalus]
MSVRYRYGTVSVLYRILRVGIGIIPIPYRIDTENAKKWIPIGIPIGIGIGTGSVRDRYSVAYAHPCYIIVMFRKPMVLKTTHNIYLISRQELN